MDDISQHKRGTVVTKSVDDHTNTTMSSLTTSKGTLASPKVTVVNVTQKINVQNVIVPNISSCDKISTKPDSRNKQNQAQRPKLPKSDKYMEKLRLKKKTTFKQKKKN